MSKHLRLPPFLVIEYLVGISAFLLFTYNSYLTYKDYLEERAGLNQYSTTEKELSLPAITVCPKDLFKKTDANSTSVLMNLSNYVYDEEDIFGNRFLSQLDRWKIHEVFGTSIGRCFTIEQTENVTQFSQTWIPFKPNLTLKVFFHEAGNEYWLQSSQQAVPNAEIELDTFALHSNDVGFSQVHLKKHLHLKINRKQYACKADVSLENFTKCAFEELATSKNGHCLSILNFGESLNESNICQNGDDFTRALLGDSVFLKRILSNTTSKCPKPCQTSIYDAEFKKYHKNAYLLLPQSFGFARDEYFLGIFYDQFMIEHQDEYLVVDGSALLSNIGGFLGLFLGFSLLSISDSAISLSQKVFIAMQKYVTKI